MRLVGLIFIVLIFANTLGLSNQKKSTDQKIEPSKQEMREHRAILRLVKNRFFVKSHSVRKANARGVIAETWDSTTQVKKGQILSDAVEVLYYCTTGANLPNDDDPDPPLKDKFLFPLLDLPLLDQLRLIGKNDITDEGLKIIGKCTKLKELRVDTKKLTGKGLSYLANLNELEKFRARFVDVSDEHLKAIRHCKKINLLMLKSSQSPKSSGITDEGFAYLKAMTKLEYISIEHATITDRSIPILLNMPKLKVLSLEQAKKLTDLAVAEIAKLKNLEHLDLSGTKVGDEAIPELKKLKNLTYLSLRGTPLTDQGLLELAKLKNLDIIYVSKTILNKTIKKIKKTRPDLQIHQ